MASWKPEQDPRWKSLSGATNLLRGIPDLDFSGHVRVLLNLIPVSKRSHQLVLFQFFWKGGGFVKNWGKLRNGWFPFGFPKKGMFPFDYQEKIPPPKKKTTKTKKAPWSAEWVFRTASCSRPERYYLHAVDVNSGNALLGGRVRKCSRFFPRVCEAWVLRYGGSMHFSHLHTRGVYSLTGRNVRGIYWCPCFRNPCLKNALDVFFFLLLLRQSPWGLGMAPIPKKPQGTVNHLFFFLLHSWTLWARPNLLAPWFGAAFEGSAAVAWACSR